MIVESMNDEANRNSAANLMAMLGNSKRLLIISLLVESEISVGELAKISNLSQSALSQHLAKLRSLQLVTTRRDAQTIYYSCASSSVITVLRTLDALFSECGARPHELSVRINLPIQVP